MCTLVAYCVAMSHHLKGWSISPPRNSAEKRDLAPSRGAHPQPQPAIPRQELEFACSDGVLEFVRTGGTGSNGGGWYGSSVVRVAKDEDRWLVVSHDDSSVALLGYAIPIYMTGVTWSRFKPLTDGPAPEN